MLSANDKVVLGNSNNGIAYNGYQYFVLINGDKIGTFGDNIEFAKKIYRDKTGKKI